MAQPAARSNETIKQAAIAGLGIAFHPGAHGGAELAEGRLIVLDVAALPIVRQWHLIRRSDKVRLPPAQAMFDFPGSEGSNHLSQVPDLGERWRSASVQPISFIAIVAARMTMIWSRRSVVKMRLKVVIARPGRRGDPGKSLAHADAGVTP